MRASARTWTACPAEWKHSESETPRLSSRETATPPYWVSGRDGVAGNRLCELIRKERLMLSGPRRAQAGANLPVKSARNQDGSSCNSEGMATSRSEMGELPARPTR